MADPFFCFLARKGSGKGAAKISHYSRVSQKATNRIESLFLDEYLPLKFRELYYQLLRHDGGTMEQIDEAIQTIVVMLQIPRHSALRGF